MEVIIQEGWADRLTWNETGKKIVIFYGGQKEALFVLLSKLILKYDLPVEAIQCDCLGFTQEDLLRELKCWVQNEMVRGDKGKD